MLLLQGLNAVRLDGPAPRGVVANMEMLIARAPEPQVFPATPEDIARILGEPAPARGGRPPAPRRDPADRPARGGDHLRRAEEERRHDPKVIAFNAEVEQRATRLREAPLTRRAIDLYNQLTQELTRAVERRFAPKGLGWPEERDAVIIREELRRLAECIARLRQAEVGLRQDLESAQALAADLEYNDLRETHLNVIAYERILEEFNQFFHKLSTEISIRNILTAHKIHPRFEALPHEGIIQNPKNYDEDFTLDVQYREVIAFTHHQVAQTTFRYMPQEAYFALAAFYMLPPKDGESPSLRLQRSRADSSRERWINTFKTLEHLRVKVDDHTVISGATILMVALNNLTTDQLQTFFENLAAENFLTECPKAQLKFVLDGMKVIIGNMERYASLQDQAQEQLFDYLQRHAGDAGVSFAIIGTMPDDALTDLKDFIDQYPANRARLITDAQYRGLKAATTTKEEFEAIMRNCFEYTRDLFRQKLRDEGSALGAYANTTWETVKQHYKYDFSKMVPSPRGFLNETARFLDQLNISGRDANFAPHITKAEMIAAMREAGDAAEGISKIIIPISTKFYNRLRYLQGKRPFVAYAPQKCYDTLIRWIRDYVDLEGEDKRNAYTGQRELKYQAELPGVLEFSRNNMRCILEVQSSGGGRVWDPAGAIGETLTCFGNVWTMRWGRKMNYADGYEAHSWGINLATFPRNSTLSMAEIITYLDQRIQKRGEGAKDEIFAFLYAILLDGNGFCENGKLLRAIRQMAELPEFRYDTSALFRADNK